MKLKAWIFNTKRRDQTNFKRINPTTASTYSMLKGGKLTVRRFLRYNYICINVRMDYMPISAATYSSFYTHQAVFLHYIENLVQKVSALAKNSRCRRRQKRGKSWCLKQRNNKLPTFECWNRVWESCRSPGVALLLLVFTQQISSHLRNPHWSMKNKINYRIQK